MNTTESKCPIVEAVAEMVAELSPSEKAVLSDIIVNHCGDGGANLFREFVLCQKR